MKVSNPLSFSRAFGIKKSELRRLGVLDPALNVDTKLSAVFWKRVNLDSRRRWAEIA